MRDYDAHLAATYGPDLDGEQVKVCPICHESSDDERFWLPRCEAAWQAEQKAQAE